jgi:hypothetical protein
LNPEAQEAQRGGVQDREGQGGRRLGDQRGYHVRDDVKAQDAPVRGAKAVGGLDEVAVPH